MSTVDNAAVARVLREMGHLLRAKGESIYKSRAYERAADRILELKAPLDEMVAQRRLEEIPGVGASLAHAIEEIVHTGGLASHQKLREQHSPFVALLAELPGVGPKKAQTLWETLHVESFEELERALRAGKLSGVKGFGPKLQRALLTALASPAVHAPAETKKEHRLKEAQLSSEALLSELRAQPDVARAEVAGETRRWVETVRELELTAASDNPQAVLDVFAKSPRVFETLSREPQSLRVQLFEDDLPARLTVISPRGFTYAWLRASGSPAHLAQLEARAKELDVDLATLPAKDEAALYRALDLTFIPPELREGDGEVEAAARGELPVLLEPTDVRGLVHSHSTWSDGNASLEEMAVAARAAGYQYLTVTDHSPTAFYAGGLSVEALERLWDEVDRLNEKLDGITLLKGTESDITSSGTLDYPDRILARLDVVIGSVHARYRMDEAKMTQRILDAMDSPYLHILGHLTGRLILSRPPYALRIDEVLEKAARKGIAVEINGSPSRLDIRSELVRRALALGVKLVVSADSHSIREIGNVRYAVGVARKGWATKADVLNTRSAKSFLAALKKRG